MSKNEFDELLLKKLREEELEYDPAGWEKIAQLLPTGIPVGITEFDTKLTQKLEEEELAYDPGNWEKLAQLLPLSRPAGIHEFDQAIVSKLAEEELVYSATGWDNLSQLLPPAAIPLNSKKRNWVIPTGIAAALVLLLGSALFFGIVNKEKEGIAVQPALATTLPAITPALPKDQPATGTPTAPQPGLLQHHISTAARQTAAPLLHNYQHPSVVLPLNNSPLNSDHNTIGKTPVEEIVVAKEEQQVVIIPEVKKEIKEEPFVVAKSDNKSSGNYAYNNMDIYPSAFYEGKATVKSPKTSIAVAGGVNYGNLNTGYSAGVSVRRKVAGDFFVDGTVAMMYNNNASNVVNYSGPPATNDNSLAARPAAGKMSVSSPAIEPTQNLYYVQFNPSFGYQIEKHVALSVGGDFQQMVRKKEGEEKVQLISNNAKLFPNFDVGLTTKSEFSITPNIQAGLLYREGLNNLLKSEGSKYVNRRYVQVQFKYNLPVN